MILVVFIKKNLTLIDLNIVNVSYLVMYLEGQKLDEFIVQSELGCSSFLQYYCVFSCFCALTFAPGWILLWWLSGYSSSRPYFCIQNGLIPNYWENPNIGFTLISLLELVMQ